MKTSNLFYLLIIAIFSFTACDKDCEVGSQGPAGPKGDTGASGNTGAQGNANVYSQLFYLTPANWLPYGSNAYQTIIVDSNLTKAIVDSGMVSVYYFHPMGSWTPLPYYQIIQPNTNIFRTWLYFYSMNQISIRVEDNISSGSNPGNTNFKVVAISASVRNAYPHLNWNNYEEVRNVFDLKD